MTQITNLSTPKLLSEKDVAELLGMSIKWVQQARYRGIGPRYIKLGSAINAPVKYLPEDIISWCKSNTRSTTQAMDS